MNGKYIKYAIGEIFLVMIGILLALGINNWNESRKNKTVEKQILDEMLISLKNDLDIFKMLEVRLMEKDSAIQTLFDFREKRELPNGKVFGGIIGTARRSYAFTYDMSPYQSLVALGINKMSDKYLFNAINNYYNQDLPRAVKFIENIQGKYDPLRDASEEAAVKMGILKRIFMKDENGRWDVQYQSDPSRLFNDDQFYQSMVIEFKYMDQSLSRIRNLIRYNMSLIGMLEK